MFAIALDSYAAGMETMKSLTPQLTLVEPSTPQAAGLAKRGMSLALKALKAVGHHYMEAARHNPYWIGSPAVFSKQTWR
jgi:hypothetical protein